VIGHFVHQRPARYSGMRLGDLCTEMHAFFRDSGTSTLQRAQFAPEHLPSPAMPPCEAVRQMVRNNVDYLPLDQAFGRIALRYSSSTRPASQPLCRANASTIGHGPCWII
jgi:ornithine decarboxylase